MRRGSVRSSASCRTRGESGTLSLATSSKKAHGARTLPAEMVFSYYNQLSASQKRIYRRSDEIHAVPLLNASALRPLLPELSSALEHEDRAVTEDLCRKLAAGIASGLQTPTIRVNVLAVRPHASWGELQGLYVPAQGRASAVISVGCALRSGAWSWPSGPF